MDHQALTPYQGKRRCLGKFKCENCGRKWISANSWADHGQMCKNCKTFAYPYEQRVIGPHLQHLCQKCIQLGRPCNEKFDHRKNDEEFEEYDEEYEEDDDDEEYEDDDEEYEDDDEEEDEDDDEEEDEDEEYDDEEYGDEEYYYDEYDDEEGDGYSPREYEYEDGEEEWEYDYNDTYCDFY